MEENLEQLQRWIDSSDNIVFFGGAGVSTESGIPDFRGVDGLYHQQFAYPPEVMLSHSFYSRHPEEFFDFYRKKMLVKASLTCVRAPRSVPRPRWAISWRSKIRLSDASPRSLT